MRKCDMKDANWLFSWRNDIQVHAGGRSVLELGCGQGADSQILASQGLRVVSVDLDVEALACCQPIEGCLPVNADISSSLPFRDDEFCFVLASLSLHYFSWADTLSIVQEIQRVLTDDGVLLMRVNSTQDILFGAGSGDEIEKNYYLNNGQKKRFFEMDDVRSMLNGMTITGLRHETIDRYGKDKRVWVAQATVQ